MLLTHFYSTNDCIVRAEARTNRQLSIAERYRLNHTIVVLAACQALVCGTLCLQAHLQAAC